jgi:uncharacterized protein with FMN-binding domain
MRRIVFAAMSTISGLVLLFSYHTSTNRAAASDALAPSTDVPADEDAPAAGGSQAGVAAVPGDAASGAKPSGTFTGANVGTEYGDVRVQITVKKGKITKSQAIAYPKSSPKSVSLSGLAVPALGTQAVEVQSAKIDLISGATSTSQGYTKSLQSAIDKAFQ